MVWYLPTGNLCENLEDIVPDVNSETAKALAETIAQHPDPEVRRRAILEGLWSLPDDLPIGDYVDALEEAFVRHGVDGPHGWERR